EVLELRMLAFAHAPQLLEHEKEERRPQAREPEPDLPVAQVLRASRDLRERQENHRRERREAHVVFALELGEVVVLGIGGRGVTEVEFALEPRVGEKSVVVGDRMLGQYLARGAREEHDRAGDIDTHRENEPPPQSPGNEQAPESILSQGADLHAPEASTLRPAAAHPPLTIARAATMPA